MEVCCVLTGKQGQHHKSHELYLCSLPAEMTQRGSTSQQNTQLERAPAAAFALLKRPRGGFEATPTTQNSPSCTQLRQELLWFHPSLLRFGFGARRVKACLTPTRSKPQGPPWEGTALQLRLLYLSCTKCLQHKKP